MVRWLMAMVALLISVASQVESKQMECIKIGKDRRSFILATSDDLHPHPGPLPQREREFVPRGFNYDRDADGRLLEDYWETEWPKVQEDFAEMKALGANVVRVHLQFGRFMQSPDKANEQALDRLERLVSLAENTGLYLDITGLACYRKEHIPDWYDRLSEKERWRAQAVFWGAIAARCAERPGVFCYDLMNEPVVPTGRREPGEWLGPPFAKVYHYVQFIALDQQDRERPDITRDWLRTMKSAIRKHDRRHLITVGMLPTSSSGFAPKEVARELDFLSVHIYPESSKMEESLDTLKEFSVGKPLVIEEVFPMHCSISELRRFLTDSEKYAAGWIGFYWGKTPEQCRGSDSLADALMLGWLELFQRETKPSADQAK